MDLRRGVVGTLDGLQPAVAGKESSRGNEDWSSKSALPDVCNRHLAKLPSLRCSREVRKRRASKCSFREKGEKKQRTMKCAG